MEGQLQVGTVQNYIRDLDENYDSSAQIYQYKSFMWPIDGPKIYDEPNWTNEATSCNNGLQNYVTQVRTQDKLHV